jgi:hypothetical protein
MRTAVILSLLLLTMNCQAQEENTILDTTSLVLVSEDLFGCECYNLPDTFNFGLPRPLDNDYFMIEMYGNYLMERYGVDRNKYQIGIMYTVLPEPKGELLKHIWVEISFSKKVTDHAEEYYSYMARVIPLCAIEELYRSSGSEAINTDFGKTLDFDVRWYRKQEELSSK